MSRCFNFELRERQRKEMSSKLFRGEWSAERYYEMAFRRMRKAWGWCGNCEAHHDLPLSEQEVAR